MARITEHAVDRYIERIDGRLSRDDAHALMAASSRIIDIAADFGAPVVRLGNGAKLVLQGDVVTTVLERRRIVWSALYRPSLGEFGRDVAA